MDKGKVFRNLAKKKLAEYIQQKEEKGEQESHSETVPTTKGLIQAPEQRKRYAIDLDFMVEGKKVPVKMNVNLSIPERRKFANYVKYISNAIKLKNSTVLVERLNNLLKRLVAEKDNYSIDFSNAMRDLLKALNEKLIDIVPEAGRKEGLEGVRNVFNQLVELFEERLAELMPVEEGEPAVEEKEEQISIPIGEEKKTKKIRIRKKRALPDPSISGKNQKKREELKRKANELYERVYPAVLTVAKKNKLYKLLADFITKIASTTFTQGLTKGQLDDGFNEVKDVIESELISAAAPAQIEEEAEENPFGVLGEEEEEVEKESGEGMRKGRHNTYRGHIGYGHVDMRHGFATAPMNANSALGQQAFHAPQSNAIPKYLNMNIIPNKRGNFAVLE
jgi:hypothetical protein